jgi:hypothetical protein
MKKIISILAAITFFGMGVKAQDIITLKNGDEIRAKVQEIGLSDVKYKKYDNLAGPTYTLLKTEILLIKYENGEKDIFKDAPIASNELSPDKPQKKLQFKSSFLNAKFTNAYGEKLSKREIRSILADVPEALKKYESGRNRHTAGWTLYGISLGCLLTGGYIYGSENYELMLYYGSAGIGCFVAALIFHARGDSKWKAAYNIYQNNKNRTTASLNFGLTYSGIGFTLNF